MYLSFVEIKNKNQVNNIKIVRFFFEEIFRFS